MFPSVLHESTPGALPGNHGAADVLGGVSRVLRNRRPVDNKGSADGQKHRIFAKMNLMHHMDEHAAEFIAAARRCRELEAENVRLRKELKDYMDAASVEAFEGDLARKDAASLAADLTEAVKMMADAMPVIGNMGSDWGDEAFAKFSSIVAKHKGADR